MSNIKRKTINRIPPNHKLAERDLIILIKQDVLEIDNNGYVYRKKIRVGKKTGGSHLVNIEKKRAENKTGIGYLQVRATPIPKGKRIHALAHRLVWHYFFGPIPEGMCINHKNGIKNDNRPENLEVCSYSENMKHAFKIGLMNQNGEKNPNAKLSNKDVKIIRYLYSTGKYYQQEIAKKYKVSHQTISKIIRGDRRKTQSGKISLNNRKKHMLRNKKTGQFTKLIIRR